MNSHETGPALGSPDAERDRAQAAQRATNRLLRLYPAGYRALHGDEIMFLHCDARLAADGRLALLREDLNLAAHGIRTRLRITSAFAAGRALGSAAGWLMAGAGASAAYALVEPAIYGRTRPPVAPVSVVLNVLLLLGLGLAVAGFWALAKPLTILAGTALAATMDFSGPSLHWNHPRAIFIVVTAVLLLCVPPDIRPTPPRARFAMLATAAALALPLGTWKMGMDVHLPGYEPTDYAPWPVIVLAVVALTALGRVSERPAAFAGAVLAVLPWLCRAVVIPLLAGEVLAFAAMALIGVLLNRVGRNEPAAASEF